MNIETNHITLSREGLPYRSLLKVRACLTSFGHRNVHHQELRQYF